MNKIMFFALLAVGLWVVAPLPAQITVPGTASNLTDALNQAASNPGSTITITANLEEDNTYFVGTPVTIQGQTPGITLRGIHLLLTASNITLKDLTINGKLTGGARTNTSFMVVVGSGQSNILIENCTIINPATGTGDGVLYSGGAPTASLGGESSCVRVDTSNNVTIRDCNFVNDDDGLPNIVGIDITAQTPGNGPILIENNRFFADARNIQISCPHRNITIRGNTFLGENLGSENGGGSIFLATDFGTDDSGPRGTPIRDLVIEGNTFGVLADGINHANNAINLHGPIDGVYIRNNTFNVDILSESVYAAVYGTGLTITDNIIGADANGTGSLIIQSTSVDLIYPEPGLRMDGVLIRNNDFPGVPGGTAIGFGELVYNALVEKNNITDCPIYGVWSYYQPSEFMVRNNTFTRCGTQNGNVDAAVLVQSENCGVVGNAMIDCRDGVSMDPENLVRDANVEIASNNLLIAYNYMLRPTRYGVEDTNGSDTFADVLAQNVRIINNTIVFPGVGHLSLGTKATQLYNNIFFGGTLLLKGTTWNATPDFTRRGFNLNFGVTWPAEYPAMPTDITANPMLVGGFAPASVGDLALLPDSPARDAGTSDGYTPDYVTDIGAWQGVQVNTSVNSSQWENYR